MPKNKGVEPTIQSYGRNQEPFPRADSTDGPTHAAMRRASRSSSNAQGAAAPATPAADAKAAKAAAAAEAKAVKTAAAAEAKAAKTAKAAEAKAAKTAKAAEAKAAKAAAAAAAAPKEKRRSRGDVTHEMLSRKEGTSIAELTSAFAKEFGDGKEITARLALSKVPKARGYTTVKRTDEKRGTVWTVAK